MEIIANVQLAYWELTFALRNEQNQLANLNLARESFRRIELTIAAGAGAPLQRTEVQTEIAARESALLLASQYVSVAENKLKTLILVDPAAPDWSSSLVPTDQPAVDLVPVDLDGALLDAKNNRPELLRLQLQRSINDIDLDYFKDQTKPRVELQATLSTTGLAGSPLATIDPLTGQSSPSLAPQNLRGGYYRNLRNLAGFKTHNIVVGLTIEFPLHNRSAKANLAGAQIEREQLDASVRFQGLTIEEQVRNSVQAVETARLRVLSARGGSESARLQLTGEQRLFEVGRSTTFLLIQRENQLIAARTQELRAETDYNKALSDLQRSTFTTLQANNVVILTPLAP
jgi:HAE1 family hydrophobic/amphiphilic exporter-1